MWKVKLFFFLFEKTRSDILYFNEVMKHNALYEPFSYESDV